MQLPALEKLPQVIIFEGDQIPEKAKALRSLAAEILYRYRLDETETPEMVQRLTEKNMHPDYVEFADENVMIGPEKDPPPQTVRHLLRRVLPYAPWKSRARVIVFFNAAGIKDAAETALLKTLEEPPRQHYFFLSVQSAEILKETIRSRAVTVRLKLPPPEFPSDPWQRFYVLTGAHDFIAEWPQAAEQIIAGLRNTADILSFSERDFVHWEKALYTGVRLALEKENLSAQIAGLHFAALPLWAALRDRVTGGIVPSFSPLVVHHLSPQQALAAASLVQSYLRKLELRVFGNRPLNPHTVFYSFFLRFFALWVAKDQ
ncbi:MAG: hypothetical protein N2Z22_06175 [Turneriella sp.]|nr:hypothetical protein [Leptospiraceae bacterium]MCX7632900.1 hypothetical protein [Turneriella sp.]